MKSLVYLFVISKLYFDQVEGTPRIVGGFEAPKSYGRFHASLQNLNGIHVCGGAIISNSHVLTAAHCVYDVQPEWIKIVIGTTNLDQGGKQYYVSSIVVHDKFNFTERIHDIAIIKVTKAFDKCKTRTLSLYENELRQGNVMILSGFGAQEPNGVASRLMYALNLTVFDQETCRFAMRNVREVHDEMFCTFSTIGEGTCHGDSGGPIVKDNFLIGLVSWGIPCAVGFPDVHTRISSYVEWIEGQLKQQ